MLAQRLKGEMMVKCFCGACILRMAELSIFWRGNLVVLEIKAILVLSGQFLDRLDQILIDSNRVGA